MAARICIHSGIASGTTFWIERPVVRIGSDPSSDLCIPSSDVSSHALTVEYREGQYRVHNRSQSDLFVGGRVIEPHASRHWRESDLLELPDGVQLALELEGDGVPASKPLHGLNGSEAGYAHQAAETATPHASPSRHEATPGASQEAQGESSPRKAKRGVLGPILITCLCLAGCVLLILRERGKSHSDHHAGKLNFAGAIRLAQAPNSGVADGVVHHLQWAEAAVLRGDRESARRRYRRARDRLLADSPQFASGELPTSPTTNVVGAASAHTHQRIAEFVEQRLAQLESSRFR